MARIRADCPSWQKLPQRPYSVGVEGQDRAPTSVVLGLDQRLGA